MYVLNIIIATLLVALGAYVMVTGEPVNPFSYGVLAISYGITMYLNGSRLRG